MNRPPQVYRGVPKGSELMLFALYVLFALVYPPVASIIATIMFVKFYFVDDRKG